MFRNVFVEKCMYHNVFMNNKDQKAIQMILNVICMILCKRIPEGVVSYSTDGLTKKIKLLPLPKTIGYEPMVGLAKKNSTIDVADKSTKSQLVDGPTLMEQFRNGTFSVNLTTGEACVVRVRIPTKKMTASEMGEEDRKQMKS